MKILMVTNTYLPMVGGVANSVATFTEAYRERGHEVLVAAPEFPDAESDESDVVRVPAIQNFNGSDFSVRLPIPGLLRNAVDEFSPDIVHSHHPFLMGDAAKRIAADRELPLVYTHHTMYEQYTHYVPGDLEVFKTFIVRLATAYANLAQHLIAPSESIADVLRERGVTTPITAVPTGVDREKFAEGDGNAGRERIGIPDDAYVIGHVGRLAPEKNLGLLADAAADAAGRRAELHVLIVGDGPSTDDIRRTFAQRDLADRLHLTGKLTGQQLIDAYHAMDVFGFTSKSETQGMVLAEAMAAGLPVVALDAPGVREIVRDRENGYLLLEENAKLIADRLVEIAEASDSHRKTLRDGALSTADQFTTDRCAETVLEIYADLAEQQPSPRSEDGDLFAKTLRRLETEWRLWTAKFEAAADAMGDTP